MNINGSFRNIQSKQMKLTEWETIFFFVKCRILVSRGTFSDFFFQFQFLKNKPEQKKESKLQQLRKKQTQNKKNIPIKQKIDQTKKAPVVTSNPLNKKKNSKRKYKIDKVKARERGWKGEKG